MSGMMRKFLGFGLIVLLLALGLSDFTSFSSPTPQAQSYEDEGKMRLFGKKDLYDNQNYSESIDRLRTASFKDIPKQEVSERKLSQLDKKKPRKKIKKKKRKHKKNKKKKKKDKEKKKTETDEDSDREENIVNKDDNGLSGESLLDLAPSQVVIQNQDVDANQNVGAWTQLLLSDPSQSNFELFYQAFLAGELTSTSYYQVHYSLYEALSSSYMERPVELLLLSTSADSFFLLYNYQVNKETALDKSLLRKISTNLASYGDTTIGILSLKSLFYKENALEQKILALDILNSSSQRYLQASNHSQSRGDSIYREDLVNGTASESTSNEFTSAFKQVLSSLSSPALLDENDELLTELQQFLVNLNDLLPGQNNLNSGNGGRGART